MTVLYHLLSWIWAESNLEYLNISVSASGVFVRINALIEKKQMMLNALNTVRLFQQKQN